MPQFLNVSWFLRMSPFCLNTASSSAFTSGRFASRRDWITSSTLALESDSGGS